MKFELTGKLIEKFDTQVVSDRFKKREFVVQTDEDVNGNVYTETIKFQLVQDKCDILDAYSINDIINVSFNIKGKRWEKNGQVSYFNNLDAWRIDQNSSVSTPSASAPENDIPLPTEAPAFSEDDDSDDLPF